MKKACPYLIMMAALLCPSTGLAKDDIQEVIEIAAIEEPDGTLSPLTVEIVGGKQIIAPGPAVVLKDYISPANPRFILKAIPPDEGAALRVFYPGYPFPDKGVLGLAQMPPLMMEVELNSLGFPLIPHEPDIFSRDQMTFKATVTNTSGLSKSPINFPHDITISTYAIGNLGVLYGHVYHVEAGQYLRPISSRFCLQDNPFVLNAVHLKTLPPGESIQFFFKGLSDYLLYPSHPGSQTDPPQRISYETPNIVNRSYDTFKTRFVYFYNGLEPDDPAKAATLYRDVLLSPEVTFYVY